MKTTSQKLSLWIEDKLKESNNEKELNLLKEFQNKLHELTDDESFIINCAYDKGYVDREMKKYKKSNYYASRYKTNELLLSFKKNMKDGN